MRSPFQKNRPDKTLERMFQTKSHAWESVGLAHQVSQRAARRARAEAALGSVGLLGRAHHLPSELSGGQQQRAALARAIVTNPALVLADEPTGNLDSHTTTEVLSLFGELNEEGRTVLLITHEPDVAARSRRVIRLADGRVVGDGPPADDALLAGAMAASPGDPPS